MAKTERMTALSAEDLPNWAEDLVKGGLSREKVREILGNVLVSNEKEGEPDYVKNATIPAGDIPEWATVMLKGGFSPDEVQATLKQMNLDQDTKEEIRGNLRRIKIRNLDKEQKVDVKFDRK